MELRHNNFPMNDVETTNTYETRRMDNVKSKGPGLLAKLAAAAVAFAYLGSPIDLIPDFIPVLGQVDDITALYLAYRYIFLTKGE